MKKSGIIFIVFLLLQSSCKKVNNTTDFELNYQASFIIHKNTPVLTPVVLTTDPTPTNINDVVKSKNSSIDLINRIKLTKVKLSITNLPNENFDFLSSVNLYIKASGLPNIRIGWKDHIVNNLGNEIELILLSDDLQSYFKKEDVNFGLDITKDETTSQNITIRTEIFLEVAADLLD